MADPQDLHDAAWGWLQAIDGANPALTAYDTLVPQNPPVDAEGNVKGYVVLFASPGRLYASGLDGGQASRDSTFSIRCAGGTPAYAFWVVSKVQATLPALATINGRQYQIRAREDFDPGEIQRDETKTTPRFFLPLELRLHVP